MTQVVFGEFGQSAPPKKSKLLKEMKYVFGKLLFFKSVDDWGV